MDDVEVPPFEKTAICSLRWLNPLSTGQKEFSFSIASENSMYSHLQCHLTWQNPLKHNVDATFEVGKSTRLLMTSSVFKGKETVKSTGLSLLIINPHFRSSILIFFAAKSGFLWRKSSPNGG